MMLFPEKEHQVFVAGNLEKMEKNQNFRVSKEYIFGPIYARNPDIKNTYIACRTPSQTMCVGREGCFFFWEP